jgi:hypothetical protein
MTATLRVLPEKPDLLHPAFDIRGDVISYGFTVDGATENGHKRTTTLHLVGVDGSQVGSFGGSHGEACGRTLRCWDTDNALPPLDDQWDRRALIKFMSDPACLSGADLYHQLMSAWRDRVEFDHDGKYVIVLCWGLMTYFYLLFPSVPFLHFLGGKNTGKSQTLDVMQQLARQGHKSRTTPAATGDLIQSRRVTVLFDQADNLKPEHVDMFADSYRAGARRTIVDFDNRGSPQDFDTFGPKAFAGTKYLDEDLADRAILIPTTPASRNLIPAAPGDVELTRLRCECYKWALKNANGICDLTPFRNPNWAALGAYWGRQRDLWLPIECIMEALGVPDQDRDAARDHYRRSQSNTKAELPDDKHALLQVLLGSAPEGSTWTVKRSLLLAGVQDLEPDGPDESDWNPKKIGKTLKTLGVLTAAPKRTEGNRDRLYAIDGVRVRSLCDRYGITV